MIKNSTSAAVSFIDPSFDEMKTPQIFAGRSDRTHLISEFKAQSIDLEGDGSTVIMDFTFRHGDNIFCGGDLDVSDPDILSNADFVVSGVGKNLLE